jgi:hypothetical protein
MPSRRDITILGYTSPRPVASVAAAGGTHHDAAAGQHMHKSGARRGSCNSSQPRFGPGPGLSCSAALWRDGTRLATNLICCASSWNRNTEWYIDKMRNALVQELLEAAALGQLKTLQALLKSGADPNQGDIKSCISAHGAQLLCCHLHAACDDEEYTCSLR